jgi:hypothetical protein
MRVSRRQRRIGLDRLDHARMELLQRNDVGLELEQAFDCR